MKMEFKELNYLDNIENKKIQKIILIYTTENLLQNFNKYISCDCLNWNCKLYNKNYNVLK